ncbi:hypothetical protein BDF19DRAFT_446862 [Syncephalis fuscata]|nr:hypothetical protein BDF19DRAFT_446862 [Syncephalis fuscata]
MVYYIYRQLLLLLVTWIHIVQSAMCSSQSALSCLYILQYVILCVLLLFVGKAIKTRNITSQRPMCCAIYQQDKAD